MQSGEFFIGDHRNEAESVKIFDHEVKVTEIQDGASVVVYESGDVLYICKAKTGALKTTAIWQIKKVDMTSGVITTWADGNDFYDNLATDLATVADLDYS